MALELKVHLLLRKQIKIYDQPLKVSDIFERNGVLWPQSHISRLKFVFSSESSTAEMPCHRHFKLPLYPTSSPKELLSFRSLLRPPVIRDIRNLNKIHISGKVSWCRIHIYYITVFFGIFAYDYDLVTKLSTLSNISLGVINIISPDTR